MSAEVIARDAEWSIVEAFLDRPLNGPRGLMLVGEAGIGKSTLWSKGVAAARQRFPFVAASQPAESERSLANVVLADLFGEVPTSVLGALPGPRRRAFERALLQGDADDTAVDPRALAAAVLSILTVLAAEGPLLLAIDDDQWADPSSVAALGFALRRLPSARIMLLLATRADGGAAEGSGLDRALSVAAQPGAVEFLHLGPLSLGAVQALLRSRLGVTLSRPNLVRLAEASGGNPFFALELARAQPTGGPPGPIVVPASLERLLAGRLDGLDDPTRRSLLLIAAHGRATPELLRRLDLRPEVVERAVADHVLESSVGVVRFTHPLLASTVLQRATAADLRAAHLQLARVVDDPVGRARHLALGSIEPSIESSSELESAAVIAQTRGTPIVAAELAEQALRLTPAERNEDWLRRGALAARAHLAAGDAGRVRELVRALLDRAPNGPSRADVLILATELEQAGPAVELLQEAFRAAAADPVLRATIHTRLAEIGRMVRGSPWAEQHARAARLLAERLGDEPAHVLALANLAILRFDAADPDALDLAREAHRRAAALPDPRPRRVAAWAVGHLLTWLRRHDEARDWFESVLADAAERDELLRAECLWYLALVEAWAGRYDRAAARASESEQIQAQYGLELPQDHFPPALVALYRGQPQLARDHSDRALALASGMLLPGHEAILGTAELWAGRPEAAVAYLVRANSLDATRGWKRPEMLFGRPEYVEALLELGRVEEAERLVDDWAAASRRCGGEWALAELVRLEGLLAAARGELAAAGRRLEMAARRHERTGDAFNRGRALLELGGVRRRQRQKRLARTALEGALVTFEALGAAGLVEATRRELDQLGGRRRIEGLSPSERRVAELVAEGRSNREVAALLFLGERTVASHLTHAYAKLGVRSRTGLVSRLAGEHRAHIAESERIAAEAVPDGAEPSKVPTS
jgi:DNA-binding CsgD family transcriptional regulator